MEIIFILTVKREIHLEKKNGYYWNGNKRIELNYLDGKKHGQSIGYHEDGQKSFEFNFFDGK